MPVNRRTPLVLVASLVLAACSAAPQASPPPTSPASTGSAAPSPTASADAAAFPVTIEHKYGTTVIPAAPTRIVTAGFNDEDYALAFGVVPLGVRDFIGPFPEEERSWAQAALGGATPDKVSGADGALNFEAIAALRPDLILAYSYLLPEEYEKLAAIAPTLVEAEDGSLWPDHTLAVGRALGQEQQASEIVSGLDEQFAKARNHHLEFAGKSVAVVFGIDPAGYWLLEPADPRTGLFTSLGLTLPERTGAISLEQAALLDQDVVVVVGAEPADYADDELFQGLDAVREGRVVHLGGFGTEFAGALGYDSPLSLSVALDILVPGLAAALDGDPATTPEDPDE